LLLRLSQYCGFDDARAELHCNRVRLVDAAGGCPSNIEFLESDDAGWQAATTKRWNVDLRPQPRRSGAEGRGDRQGNNKFNAERVFLKDPEGVRLRLPAPPWLLAAQYRFQRIRN
jgi:hypothetical protein